MEIYRLLRRTEEMRRGCHPLSMTMELHLGMDEELIETLQTRIKGKDKPPNRAC